VPVRTVGNNASTIVRAHSAPPLVNHPTNMVAMMRLSLLLVAAAILSSGADALLVRLGSRPNFLVRDMANSPLKTSLQKCVDDPTMQYMPHDFSIGHRGAALHYPEVSVTAAAAAAPGLEVSPERFANASFSLLFAQHLCSRFTIGCDATTQVFSKRSFASHVHIGRCCTTINCMLERLTLSPRDLSSTLKL